MDIVLGTLSSIGWVISTTLHGATEKNTKVLVQVSQEHARRVGQHDPRTIADNILLSRVRIIGRHVLHERSRTTAIEEVDGTTNQTTSICRSQATIEVRKKIDCNTVDLSLGEDTWDRNADVWLSVCECQLDQLFVNGEESYSYQ